MKGENVRILRNNTKEEEYSQTMDFMLSKFWDRKFREKFLNKNIIPHKRRKHYLDKKELSANTTKRNINLTLIYNQQLNTKEAIKKNWPILASNEDTRGKLFNKKIRILL